MRKRYWLICYVWKPRSDPQRWRYENAVIDVHPTSWLGARLADPGKPPRVLVSYQEIMPYEYNDLKDVL